MVEGTKTPFSMVLMVLRLTPTRAARSACVHPRASRSPRSEFKSRSAKSVRPPLPYREADQCRADAKGHEHM